ncbi:hypothetical protein PANT_9c00091 [Moesziomyces antarcticus T-34]|uniref:Anaphase-promoting complex subunit 5 n=1 Tax=Pseudozyma antarctica (strain T-34) TaxID=1151754 RepID=M9MED7_PSEA3|nr:hypothetical protein PANT_9c00091 [Moesziomyces antarcticus T-34]
MDVPSAPPDEMNGETIAILVLFNFHCRVQLNDDAHVARKKLLLFLMDKLYQTRSPAPSYAAFVGELRVAMQPDEDDCRIVVDYLDGMLHLLNVPDGLTKLFNEKLNRILPNYEATGMLNATDIFFERRSFFGLFFRRTKLIFDSLDLQARDELMSSARAWRESSTLTMPNSDRFDLDSYQLADARLCAFRDYQLGLLRGDYMTAKDNMEKFFDFYAPGADRELHQHTLLHLATFHVRTGSFSAARAALEEAISLARSANDHDCIGACESLMLRIQGVGTSVLAAVPGTAHIPPRPNHRQPASDAVWKARCEIGKGRSALEVLHDLEEAFAPAQPSRDTLAASEASLELMDDAKRRLGRDAVAQDAEVARLWDFLGAPALAKVYHGRAEPDLDGRATSQLQQETRIDSICGRAKYLSRAGRYEQALALLISPATYRGISFSHYTTWHTTIGEILRLRAERREDEAALRVLADALPLPERAQAGCDIEDAVESPSNLVELALRYLDTGSSSEMYKAFGRRFKGFSQLTAEEAAEALLRKATTRAESEQPSLALMPTLACLSIAKEMDCQRLVLGARVQLAETLGLHLRMADGTRSLVETDLPACLANEDAELRARAQWTYARTLLSCSDKSSSEDLEKVLLWLARAEQDADAAECLGLQTRILYFLLRLHHHVGDQTSREEIALRLDRVERLWTRKDASEDETFWEQTRQILDVIVSVAGYVASGQAAGGRWSVA